MPVGVFVPPTGTLVTPGGPPQTDDYFGSVRSSLDNFLQQAVTTDLFANAVAVPYPYGTSVNPHGLCTADYQRHVYRGVDFPNHLSSVVFDSSPEAGPRLPQAGPWGVANTFNTYVDLNYSGSQYRVFARLLAPGMVGYSVCVQGGSGPACKVNGQYTFTPECSIHGGVLTTPLCVVDALLGGAPSMIGNCQNGGCSTKTIVLGSLGLLSFALAPGVDATAGDAVAVSTDLGSSSASDIADALDKTVGQSDQPFIRVTDERTGKEYVLDADEGAVLLSDTVPVDSAGQTITLQFKFIDHYGDAGSATRPSITLPPGYTWQAHHILQDRWAVENLAQYGYTKFDAPAVYLVTGAGDPAGAHTVISAFQTAARDARVAALGKAGKWSDGLNMELQGIASDWLAAGFDRATVNEALQRVGDYLATLRIPYRYTVPRA